MDSLSENITMVNQKLSMREDEYMRLRPIRIYCGTFNVNGKLPDECLRPWLCVSCEDQKSIDIYAIGFQELVDLNTKSLFLQSEAVEREAHWTHFLTNDMTNENNFKSKTKYRLLTRVRMFGLFLVIFADEKLLQSGSVQEVCTAYVATGIMDMVGNKGSVGVSLKVNESRICFVCSHLAADTDKLEKRNSDFRATRDRLRFSLDPNDLNRGTLDLENSHDAVFWFGDLNYRLDKMNLKETIRLIYANEFDELLKYDQLSSEKAKRRVFENYTEGKVNFRPTYKYLVKSDIYEKHALAVSSAPSSISSLTSTNTLSTTTTITRDAQDINASMASSNSDEYSPATSPSSTSQQQQQPNQQAAIKMKLPSWTDRVLYKTNLLECKQLQYSCINTITLSDHKPVYSIFELSVKEVDVKKKQKMYDDLLKESDRKINEEMPRISVNTCEFKFEDCMFYDAKTVHLYVKNDGVSRCTVDAFFFDNSRPAESATFSSKSAASQQWINIHPTRKERLEPNKTYTLELTTAFNYRQLARLNKTRELYDFIVLRCLNGNDLFVTLHCVYKPSVMGVSLRALSTLQIVSKSDRGGINDVSFEKCDQSELLGPVEAKIEKFETSMDEMFRDRLKECSTHMQKEHVEKMMARMDMNNARGGNNRNYDNIQASQPVSKLDIFNQALSSMKKELVDEDEYFLNDLSSEYKFLMDHLISRCTFNLENTLQQQEDTKSLDKEERPSSDASQTLTIEEQKNLALFYLSSKNYADFMLTNFDLELLGELLNDLLYALPQALIPARYIDYGIYAEYVYEKCLTLLIYLPRSHLVLFESIVKFLQIYLKCLSTCESNFNDVIAAAVFKIDKNDLPASRSSKTMAACMFVKLFIDFHTKFLSI